MQHPAIEPDRDQSHTSAADEVITIIAASMAEVMRKFNEHNLAARGFMIAGQAARQTFTHAGDAGEGDLFDGKPMLAATFIRRTQ
ncbi:MAG: hypothetical protein H6873_00950 [Hyphomicrobiaceae bacterium]|nr:hypothetical protein [Hyphomicrobiaceae bacterium]